jgi:hypothetical protein
MPEGQRDLSIFVTNYAGARADRELAAAHLNSAFAAGRSSTS